MEPGGRIVAGPLERAEDILYAEVDLGRTRGPRWMLDVAGHYARPDIFELIVHREERAMIRQASETPAEPTAP